MVVKEFWYKDKSTSPVCDILKDIGWKPKCKQVFIKPNIGATSFIANTEAWVVKDLLDYLLSIGVACSDITIGEGTVVTEYESTGYNYRHIGWDKLAEKYGVSLVDLNIIEREDKVWKFGKLGLPTVLKGKSYINIAKLKTHMQTQVSLTVKNQKGLVAPLQRKIFHQLGLHEPIAELARVIQPELCIVDGSSGIEGNGPGDFGQKKDVGVIVVGDNMVEVDVACCRIMGVDPFKVKHLTLLMGEMDRCGDERMLRWLDYKPEKVVPFKQPDAEFKMMNVHMKASNACSACQSSVGKMRKLARRSTQSSLWFLRKGLLGRLDMIVGGEEDLPVNHGYCIFYGNCTKQLANRYPQYPFAQGCPPVSKEALKTIQHWRETK